MSRVVQDYYDRHAQEEWERLEQRHPVEYAITLRALREYLPPPPCTVLDVGSGPGRYAIELAQRGYSVTVVDLSSGNLTLAQQKAAEAGVSLTALLHGNALQLRELIQTNYHAILLLGPLYHLHQESERTQAIQQAWHCLLEGGLLFAAFITRFAPVRDWMRRLPAVIAEDPDYIEHIWATGQHSGRHGFTEAYFAHPDEIIPFVESLGFSTVALINCEGLASGIETSLRATDDVAWDAWMDLNYRISKDNASHGAADHLLYIGRKV